METMGTYTALETETISLTAEEVIADYRLAQASRQASLMGRKEVFMGKAKFGIFGDGKEIAQIAMAKAFQAGDFRSGYYRDQTFMFAIGELTIQQYFAQLYAHPDEKADPATAGRLMNGHFATRLINEKGEWKELSKLKNSSADISPTAAQMPRLLGLAYASKLYRQNPDLHGLEQFSINGSEVAFGTIGDASTSEGLFWETINAGGVLQVPMLIGVWDDGYGISVPKEYHTTKGSISEVLSGFQRTDSQPGYEIFRVKGWDYIGLIDAFQKAARICREEHVPVLVHVTELTQPQGHSTSGSHERYKPKERLQWEAEHDCLHKMREWILENGLAAEEELDAIEQEAVAIAKTEKTKAWQAFQAPILQDQHEAEALLEQVASLNPAISQLLAELKKVLNPVRFDTIRAVKRALWHLRTDNSSAKQQLQEWLEKIMQQNKERFNSHLYSESSESALLVQGVEAEIHEEDPQVDGREVLRACFDAMFDRDPRVMAFGEDVGFIGDVNQTFAGLQAKYGELRITDTGIREATIIGQGIGLALRGLRPIAEIQYLDYILYALQTLSDDLASLHYRTKGGQKAPVIVRTRGHRLEGVWHSGSPIGMLLHSLRGMHVLVPRDMTQAAGFYNTLLESDEPALVIECLNGYRLKERVPRNVAEFKVPLGVPEVLREGNDVTVVTYGSMCRVVMDAADHLQEFGISCEVIDVQSLLPFDVNQRILESLKKTNRVVFTDEDVPGGATAYMMQEVIEKQGGYFYLDSQPLTLTAKAHRPAYSTDGDYFSKPNIESVVEAVYKLMAEAEPAKYPKLY
jgi:pyruvate/2-oxoglutarate/acetoin dehydrogenase E1 component/TPP-dependent pyruvate/acetoin dehydrogenase alpha subunit